MTTATQTAKPARSFRFLTAFAGTNRATIQITQRRGNAKPEVTDYEIEFIPADPSMGAAGLIFTKVFLDTRKGMVAQEYSVLINSAGVGITCTCAASLHHGFCRHRDIVPTLLKARKGSANG